MNTLIRICLQTIGGRRCDRLQEVAPNRNGPDRDGAFLGAALIALVALSAPAQGTEGAPQQILIENVHVWDGKSDGLEKADVLIEGNLIKAVGTGVKTGAGATVIEVAGER